MGSGVWSLLPCLSRAVAALSGALLLIEHAISCEHLVILHQFVKHALLRIGQLGGIFGGKINDLLTLALDAFFVLNPVMFRGTLF